jgi:hypothetical protein
MKKIVFITLAALLLFGMTLPAGAQPCTASIPTSDFEVGDTWCMEICGDWTPYPFLMAGIPGTGEANIPILTFGAGCNPQSTECEVDCDPIDPPTGEWELGGDPFGFYPDWYYIGNDCMWILIQPAHQIPDHVWSVIFVGLCDGCFCMTFDHQLPVELLNFTALAGDAEVLLNWNTASESNTDRFEIERGGDKLVEIRVLFLDRQ